MSRLGLLVVLPVLVILVASALTIGLVVGLSGPRSTGTVATTTTTAAGSPTTGGPTTGPVTTTTTGGGGGGGGGDGSTTSVSPPGIRIVNGVVGFTAPVITAPTSPACLLADSGYCGGGITVLPVKISGQGFTASNAGVRILQNLPLCDAFENTGSCPENQLATESYYDIVFDTPFTSLPAINTFVSLDPVTLGECIVGFTAAYTGTGLLVLPQEECDPLLTRFAVSVTSVFASASQVTTAGMRSTLFVGYKMCPLGNATVTRDDFCHAALLFVLQFYDPLLAFKAHFSAIGQ